MLVLLVAPAATGASSPLARGPSGALWVLVAVAAVVGADVVRSLRRSRAPGPAFEGLPAAGPPTPGGSARHVEVVDGLRGLAILLVVLFHYWQLSWWTPRIPGLPERYNLEFVQYGGYLGVELFFFISAFCLFHPHAKAMFGLGPVPTLRHFYYRRAIKIVPSYLVALAVCGVFFGGLYRVTYSHGVLGDLGLHLTFLHNLVPETRNSFDGVLWSLAVEVQFYYAFPLLAVLFRRSPWGTAAAMIALALVFRAWARHKPLASFAQWDSLMPGFLDLFALGMLAAYLMQWIRLRPDAARALRPQFTVLAVAGFGVLLLMFRWTYDLRYDAAPPEVWQSNTRQYLGLVLLCVTVASAFAAETWRRLLANRALLFLSTISYNLYIWHQILGLAIRERHWWRADTPVPMNDPHWRWTYTLIAITASVLVATLITYGFERPLLRLGVRGVVRRAAQGVRPARHETGPGPRPAADVPTG